MSHGDLIAFRLDPQQQQLEQRPFLFSLCATLHFNCSLWLVVAVAVAASAAVAVVLSVMA